MNLITGLLCGCVEIKINKIYYERLLNALVYKNIQVWPRNSNLMESETEKTIYVLEKNLSEVMDLCERRNFHVFVGQKHGLPGILKHYGCRVGFIIGFLASLVFLAIMSNCIWSIQCIGNSYYTQEEILKYLCKRNIQYGTFLSSIDLKKEANLMRKNHEEIGWCSFTSDGCMLVINMKETKVEKNKKLTKDSLSLVANHKGTIISIVTRHGTPAVTARQKVKKGDVLIYGHLIYHNDNQEITKYKGCMADGDILGRYRRKIKLKLSRKVYCEEVKKKSTFYELLTGSSLVSIVHSKPDSKTAVLKEYIRMPYLDKISPSIKIVRTRKIEYKDSYQKLSDKEIRACFENYIDRIIKKIEEKDGKILEKKLDLDDNSKEVLLSGVLYVEGPFGTLHKTKIPSIRKENDES